MKYGFMLLIFSLFLLSQCYYDSEEYLFPEAPGSCDTTNVTYSGSVLPLLDNRCFSCHGNSTAGNYGGNINLENFQQLKAQADRGALVGSINHDPKYLPMPENSSKLSSCQISIFEIWIEQNAPNN